MSNVEVEISLLGQSGCRIQYKGAVFYFDPYLSNSVEELDSPDLKRLVPIPIPPADVRDANWVIITHDHIDHCDPHTIPVIAEASPSCSFIGPWTVLRKLQEWGIEASRCRMAEEQWQQLGDLGRIRAVPAAHPDIRRNAKGQLACVGYLLEVAGKTVYFAGDTSVTDDLLSALRNAEPVSAAILPVNEHNYFRGRRGIIGNMSVRDSFQLAQEIGVQTVIPVHWDMFQANSVSVEEIREVYNVGEYGFELQIRPTKLVL
jgi:L-ascorbate 6-phosphate lactonase